MKFDFTPAGDESRRPGSFHWGHVTRKDDTRFDLAKPSTNALPIKAKLAAWYLISLGILGLLFLTIDLFHQLADSGSGASAATYVVSIFHESAWIVAGIGILRQTSWGRHFGVVVLLLGIFRGARHFAWGYAGGPPTSNQTLAATAVFAIWHGFIIFLLFNRRTSNHANH